MEEGIPRTGTGMNQGGGLGEWDVLRKLQLVVQLEQRSSMQDVPQMAGEMGQGTMTVGLWEA